MVIFKYPLAEVVNSPQTIRMPLDAIILDYQIQNNRHVIWALVDEHITSVEVATFILTWTGWANVINKEDIYIGTAQRSDGLVYHLFRGA